MVCSNFSFTTEEIFQLLKKKIDSIHLKKFIKIPENWKIKNK